MTGSIMSKNEERVKFNIVRDLADHTITVLHSNGLYRRYRCQNHRSWNMGFDIITWPGSLCFTGDMGDFLFQRTDDMVEFMRHSCMSYSYMAEKCVAGKVKEWSENVFAETLAERAKEGGEFTVHTSVGLETRSVKDAICTIKSEYANYGSHHDAMKAMCESGLWDGFNLPSCEDYTYRFLWCLHAISWFCERVDK